MGHNTPHKRTPKKSLAIFVISIALLVVIPLACSTSKTISEIEKEAQPEELNLIDRIHIHDAAKSEEYHDTFWL